MTLEKSIIKTLCYSEIFSYPLTLDELWKYLLHPRPVRKKDLEKALFKYKNNFEVSKGYITLKGDVSLIESRIRRMGYSRRKYTKALFISHLLSLIPTIKLIGVSGSLSMANAKKEDDIDLFIITSQNSLWITRFLVNSALFIMKEKRGRENRLAQDKICTNMFLSENNVSISKKQRNMYTAHEILQMKVIISKGNTQNNFLMKNKWVLKFMPNGFTKTSVVKVKSTRMSKLLIPFEFLFYKLQYFYMKKRITNEYIGAEAAMFHPVKNAEIIAVLYDLKVAARTKNVALKAHQKREKYASLN